MSQTPGTQILVDPPWQARRVPSRWLWLWPLLAAFLLGGLGWAVHLAVERTMRRNIAEHLQTTLHADVAALEIWLRSQESIATAIAGEKRVRELVALLSKPVSDKNPTLLQAPELQELRQLLNPWMMKPDGSSAARYEGFLVVSSEWRLLAADRDDLLLLAAGEKSMPAVLKLAAGRALAGESTVSRPYLSRLVLAEERGDQRSGVPTMCVLAPLRDEGDKIIAVLGLRIRPELDFTRILSVARAGDSGETYAFDDAGLMLSKSRFEDSLKQIGLVPDRTDFQSILNLELRDPAVDMTHGRRPAMSRREQPLTRPVAAAITNQSGVDVDGYRDYRGVPSVGAWTWLPNYGIGIVSEVDAAEAYRPLLILRSALWGLFGLLVGSAGVAFLYIAIARRWKHRAREAVLAARQLGQYTLDEKIGAGGMGVVYKAQHAMLRRPTAVKLLNPAKVSPTSIARFAREVQLTSGLNHPNTIAVYDYGCTAEGIFYYAMEYLDGLSLDDLVQRFGPQLEGRVIHILRQVCGSLAEAHGIGLIHRDIKPANIMINQRGGLHDYVKVLDFGLVKAVHADNQVTQTSDCLIAGTPGYLSPEAIESPGEVDARSDLYSLGAVGYFLLTSSPVFSGQSAMEVCRQHLHQPPELPSARLGRDVAPDLEAVLLGCLAKRPEDRPPTAQALSSALGRCRSAAAWGSVEAESWWTTKAFGFATLAPSDSAETLRRAVTTMVDRTTPSS